MIIIKRNFTNYRCVFNSQNYDVSQNLISWTFLDLIYRTIYGRLLDACEGRPGKVSERRP